MLLMSSTSSEELLEDVDFFLAGDDFIFPPPTLWAVGLDRDEDSGDPGDARLDSGEKTPLELRGRP